MEPRFFPLPLYGLRRSRGHKSILYLSIRNTLLLTERFLLKCVCPIKRADYPRSSVSLLPIRRRPAKSSMEELQEFLTLRLHRILAEPGLDGVIIGPHDLSINLGLPEQYHDPRFEDAVRQIISSVREKGLGVGIHFSQEAELQIKWAKAGANIIMHSSDIALFQQRLKDDFAAIRHALKEEVRTRGNGDDRNVL